LTSNRRSSRTDAYTSALARRTGTSDPSSRRLPVLPTHSRRGDRGLNHWHARRWPRLACLSLFAGTRFQSLELCDEKVRQETLPRPNSQKRYRADMEPLSDCQDGISRRGLGHYAGTILSPLPSPVYCNSADARRCQSPAARLVLTGSIDAVYQGYGSIRNPGGLPRGKRTLVHYSN